MSNDQKTTEVTSDGNAAPDDGMEIQAEAVAEAAEAIAGAAHDDSTTDSNDDGSNTSAGDPSAELDALRAERDQAIEQALRAHAELDNYRKRIAREAEQHARYQMLPLIRDILPALDNLERTMQAGQAGTVDDLLKGVEMILAQVGQVFSGYSATPIAAVGEPFDPNLHEALQQLPSAEQPAGTVLQELERGYMMHDRVIRPTKVIVACAPPDPVPDDGE